MPEQFVLMQRTRMAMSLVGIPEEEQQAVCRTVAAVLHMGNITFCEAADEGSDVSDAKAQHHLVATAELLGVSPAGLKKAFTTRTRSTNEGESCLANPERLIAFAACVIHWLSPAAFRSSVGD